MSHKTAAAVAHTIGIDTGKNTLHLIGLDDKGAIVLREKIARGRIAARLANVPRHLACCRRSVLPPRPFALTDDKIVLGELGAIRLAGTRQTPHSVSRVGW
jgi:hypothetical protein